MEEVKERLLRLIPELEIEKETEDKLIIMITRAHYLLWVNELEKIEGFYSFSSYGLKGVRVKYRRKK